MLDTWTGDDRAEKHRVEAEVLIDARSLADGSEVVCDLAVVGAGPAGISIVDRMRNVGVKVCLIESGGFEPDLRTQNLYRGENVGHSYFGLQTCRFRMFGGSSNRWGGWCRPLEPLDFEQRDWVPHSGWPIRHDTLEPYFGDASTLLELSGPRFDLDSWAGRLPEPFLLGGGDFENAIFQYSPETNFGEVYKDRILHAPNVTILIRANIVEIGLEPGTNRVSALIARALGGGRVIIRPRAAVLAAGGIENARLLLASRSDRPAGLGNEHDLVGRYFMEHLHVPAGHLVVGGMAPSRDFYRKAVYGSSKVRGVITPSSDAQRRHRLLACSIAVEAQSYSYGTPFCGWSPTLTFVPVGLYLKFHHGRAGVFTERVKSLAERARAAPLKISTGRASRAAARRGGANLGGAALHSLYFRTEQAPDPASRVSLGDRRDALNMPEARLDWRVNRVDTESILVWLRTLDGTVRDLGLGRVVMPPEGWERGIIGGPHHMGTTRMAVSARCGVVDEHCRVHSLDNLYVAGSSVFATGGYANPTFTLVALALRLADRLRERLT